MNLKKRSFTIIELIVVLATIGILFLALVPRMDSASSKAKVASVQADFRSFYAAAQQVAIEVANPVDLSEEEFETHLNSFLDSSKQFRSKESIQADPWGNEYRYTTAFLNNKFCVIFASQGDDEYYKFKTSDMADVGEAADDEEFVPRITLAFAIIDGDIFTLEGSEHSIMEDRVSNLEHPISVALSNQTVVEGSEFTFSVVLNDYTGDISYQWYRNGEVISGENSRELTMIADLAYDGSRFMCEVVKNGKTYQTNSATLTVVPNSLVSLSIESMPAKTHYYESQNFVSTGLTLKASYGNGSSAIIDNYVIQNGNSLSADQTSVTAVWGDYSVEVPITVVTKTAIGITIVSLPTNVNYVETQDFDPTGMVVAVEYNNGSRDTITNYTISGGTKLKNGTQTITVNYESFSSSFTVNVVKLQVIKLEVTNPPTKTRYLEGENFETAGMVVKATWNNGTSKNVTNTSGTTSNGSGYTPITNGYTVANGTSLAANQTSVTLRMDSATVLVPISGYNTADYTIKHWQQNLSGDANSHDAFNYTVKDTEIFQGTTDVSVKPDVKSYTGFTAPAQKTVSIKSDGSTVIDYYYTRNKYAITLFKGTGIESVSGEGDYLYGESVSIDATMLNGYTWSNWSGTNNASTKTYLFRMPAFNVENTANAVATIYQIVYDLDGGTVNENPTTYTIETENITLNNPVRAGYNFIGWTGDNGATPELGVIITKGSTGNKNFKANWEAKTDTAYTVNHYQQNISSDNYTLKETENLTGATASSVTPAVKSYTGFTAPEAQTVVIAADGKTVVDYYYTRNSYTVTINKGTGITSVSGNGTYKYGESVTIKTVVGDGYTWSGWTGTLTSTSSNYNFSMPANNVVNTANATANTYTITYHKNSDSATGTTASSAHTYGVEKALTTNGYSLTGYVFDGWNTVAGGNGTSYANGALVKNLATADSAKVTLYAQWKPNATTPYKVKHWQQNLDGDAAIKDDANYTLKDTENLAGTTGVNTTPAVKNYDGFTAPESITVNIAADGSTVINYYYTRNRYNVTLDKGVGIASVSGGRTYLFGESVTINAEVENGYTWGSWKGYYTTITKEYVFTMPASNVAVKANANAINYRIDYDLAGGSVSGNPTSYTVATETFKLKNPTKAGCTFEGWTGTNGETPQLNVDVPKGTTGNLSFKANWTTDTYTIDYELYGGSVSGNPTSYTAETDTFSLNNPTKTGYTFAGWTGSNGSTAQTSVSIAKGSTGNKTYTANWTANTYSIRFDSNTTDTVVGSMSDLNMIYDVDRKLSTNKFTREWYAFKEWNTKQDGTGTAYADEATVKNLTAANGGTVTLYAQWESIGAYAAIYGGDTLVFGEGSDVPSTYGGKALTTSWQNVDQLQAVSNSQVPWYSSYATAITSIEVVDPIRPVKTAYWFYGLENCTSMNLAKMNTSLVTDMNYMFFKCLNLASLDVSTFNVSNVEKASGMFARCENLETLSGLVNWNTQKIKDMSSIFSSCAKLETIPGIGNWNIDSATQLDSLFAGCTSLKSLDNLSGWNTNGVTNMQYMFGSCTSLAEIQGISGWDMSTVKGMYRMFNECTSLTSVGDLSSWNTASADNMQGMFYNCKKLSTPGNLGNWKTNLVTNMSNMFHNCIALTSVGNLNNWNVSAVTTTENMFYGCSALTTLGDLSGWRLSTLTNAYNMFNGCNKITTFGDLSNWGPNSLQKATAMFQGCAQLATVGDLGSWNMSSVTDAMNMFQGCNVLASIGDVSGWNLSSVQNTKFMFADCTVLDLGDIHGWNLASASDISYMFRKCKGMTELNLSGWNVSNVANMSYIFTGCETIEKLNLSGWNNANASNVSGMFNTMNKLSEVVLGANFSFSGNGSTTCVFPTPNSSYIDWADGKWYNAETRVGYTPVNVPNNTAATYVAVQPVVPISNYSWAELQQIAIDVQNGADPMDSGINIARMTKDQLTKDGFTLVDIGTDEGDYDGFTFLGELSSTKRGINSSMSNAGGYNSSRMKTELEGYYNGDTFLGATINPEIKAVIKPVDIVSNTNKSEYNSGITTYTSTGVHVFLPSLKELGIDYSGKTGPECHDLEGNTFDYYKNGGGFSGDHSAIQTGISWLRSTVTGNNIGFWNIGVSGTDYYANANISHLVCAAFVIGEQPEPYAAIYGGNTLVFGNDCGVPATYGGKALTESWTGIESLQAESQNDIPWYANYANAITTVDVVNEIRPISTARWFYDLKNATSINVAKLNTSNVTDMTYMFYQTGYNASTLDITGLNNWDVSKVTSMQGMFLSTGYNTPSLTLSGMDNWNVQSVTTMKGMFFKTGYGSTSWTVGNLNNWNVSSVTNMQNMFYQAGFSANSWTVGDLKSWNVSKVTTMNSMFLSAGHDATSWTVGNLDRWDVSSVTDMYCMFQEAGINDTNWSIGNLMMWDTSKVTNMGHMFESAGENAASWTVGNLNTWDVSKVQNMSYMFYKAGKQASTWTVGNISSWNVLGVNNMSYMFGSTGTKVSNWTVGNLGNWNVSSVNNMSHMFYYAGSQSANWTAGDLSGWITSSVTDMSYMFYNAGANATSWTVGDLGNWNTASVTSMYGTFYGSRAKELNLSNWDTSKVTNMARMFDNMKYLEKITLGDKFSFQGNGSTSCTLPTPSASYIQYADGQWYDAATKMGYAPARVPSNTAATYLAALAPGLYETGTLNMTKT